MLLDYKSNRQKEMNNILNCRQESMENDTIREFKTEVSISIDLYLFSMKVNKVGSELDDKFTPIHMLQHLKDFFLAKTKETVRKSELVKGRWLKLCTYCIHH